MNLDERQPLRRYGRVTGRITLAGAVRWVLYVAVTASWMPATAHGQHDFGDFRGLWVTRFDYRNGNEAAVRRIVDNAASIGITDVLFQVRGHGDAYYHSSVEPRAEGLAPSWDPLQIAIDQAHTRGLKLHAWINTMPLWSGTTPPRDDTTIPAPFYHTEPSYRVHDLAGEPQPLNNSYVVANPILPEWHDHVSRVAADIVSNYDVDGLHLDYVRWLGSTNWQSLPHDADSHQLFEAATGLTATSNNATAYRQFVRDQITQLVSSVGTVVKGVDPAAVFSAAVWRDPDVGSSQVLQEYRTWLEADLLDVVMPMIYLSSSNDHLFAPNLANIMAIDTDARIAPGIGVYLHDDPEFTVSQLERLVAQGTGGVTLYAYSSFFSAGQLGADRIAAVTTYLDSVPSGPDPPQALIRITDFEQDAGYFGNSPTFSGSNTGILAATSALVTEGAFEGQSAQQLTIQGSGQGWFLRHVAGQGPPAVIASPAGNLAFATDGYVGVWIKTETPGIEVSLAIDDPGTADRGSRMALAADGQWHLYEWDLNDNGQWQGWVSGDGVVTGDIVTLDSLQFFGRGDATIFLDAIAVNPRGSLRSAFIHPDVDDNGRYDGSDIDLVVAAISGQFDTDADFNRTRFDLNGDGLLDHGDLEQWLSDAGAENLDSQQPYLAGDANLDGNVDDADLALWSGNRFAARRGWTGGDFDANGITDGRDFHLWHVNKGRSAGTPLSAVPEPSCGWLVGMLSCWSLARWRRATRLSANDL